MSENKKRGRGRPRAEAGLGDITGAFPATKPDLRFKGDHYRLLVGDSTWANEIAACMADTNRFADALTLGVLIVRQKDAADE